MDMYNKLPIELQRKNNYYVLEHPTARIIKDKIKELKCNDYYTFRDKENKIFCKIDGRDHFTHQYFLKFRKKYYNDSDSTDSDGSATSDEDLDEVFF